MYTCPQLKDIPPLCLCLYKVSFKNHNDLSEIIHERGHGILIPPNQTVQAEFDSLPFSSVALNIIIEPSHHQSTHQLSCLHQCMLIESQWLHHLHCLALLKKGILFKLHTKSLSREALHRNPLPLLSFQHFMISRMSEAKPSHVTTLSHSRTVFLQPCYILYSPSLSKISATFL